MADRSRIGLDYERARGRISVEGDPRSSVGDIRGVQVVSTAQAFAKSLWPRILN
jgi:hypothetical protein